MKILIRIRRKKEISGHVFQNSNPVLINFHIKFRIKDKRILVTVQICENFHSNERKKKISLFQRNEEEKESQTTQSVR